MAKHKQQVEEQAEQPKQSSARIAVAIDAETRDALNHLLRKEQALQDKFLTQGDIIKQLVQAAFRK